MAVRIWLILYVVWLVIGDVVIIAIAPDGQMNEIIRRAYRMGVVAGTVVLLAGYGPAWPVMVAIYLIYWKK